MAAFQPILNQSNVSPFISPGVQDNSMAKLIGDLGKMGVEAYTGYQGAQLEGAIEQETKDYFSQNEAYEEGIQAGIDAEGVRIGIDKHWDNFDAKIEDVNVLERGFKEKMDKYASAMKQGKMSADQLYARIISTTREHVSRNPWLQKELLKTADDYLQLTGLGGYIKEAQRSAKETADFQAKIIEQEAKYAATVGIDPLTDPLWMDKTRQRRITISNYEDKKKQLEMLKEMRPGMLGKLISNMEQLRPATFMSLQDKAIAITTSLDQNGKPIPWDVQKMQLQTLWNTYISDTRSAFVRADPTSISDPNVSEYLKWMGEESKNFITELQNFKSGEEAMKWLETRQRAIAAQEKLIVSGVANRDALQVFGNFLQALPEGAKNRFLADPVRMEQVMGAANSMLSKVAPLNLTTAGIPVVDTLLEAGKTGKPIGTELGAAIQASVKGINDSTIVKTPIEKLKYLADFNARLANVNELANLKQLSPEDREAAVKLTQEYKDIAIFNAQKKIEDSGLSLEWNQLPNGDFTLTYTPGSKRDDAVLKNLNDTFAGHINNAHKALSHLYGRTDYNAVFKELFMGESKPGQQAWEARTPEEAFNLFDKGIIDESTYRTIMKDMLGKKEQTPVDPTIPTLSPGARERLSTPTEAPKQTGVSPEFAKELRNPKPKQQTDVKEESRKKLMDTVRMTLDSTGYKTSPLLKKSSKEDAIESISYIEALHDVPGAGPVIEAALVAFGMVNLIPTLAKRLPKMFPTMKVVPTTSNVSVAGGSSGASKAIAQGAVNEAKKEEVQRMKDLYQQYWRKEWTRYHVDLPKTDLEWSNAIAEAQRWVQMKTKNPTFKSMEK